MQAIATYSKAEQAHLLRMRLESVGIEAVLLDENMAQLEQPMSDGNGGVRLQVGEEVHVRPQKLQTFEEDYSI